MRENIVSSQNKIFYGQQNPNFIINTKNKASSSHQKPKSFMNELMLSAHQDLNKNQYCKSVNNNSGISSKVMAKHNLTDLQAKSISGAIGTQKPRIAHPPAAKATKRQFSSRQKSIKNGTRPPSGHISRQSSNQKLIPTNRQERP